MKFFKNSEDFFLFIFFAGLLVIGVFYFRNYFLARDLAIYSKII